MPRVTITVPEKTPQPYRFKLERESVSLGRGSENDIAIDCGSVSVAHAVMRRVGGGYELKDLGSTNGIKVDGERQTHIPLRSGMTVFLGDVAFEFLLSEEELDALADEKTHTSRTRDLPVRADGGPPSRPKVVHPTAQNTGGGGGMIVLFLILAAAAFFAGMAIRFQKDTGDSLLDSMGGKAKPKGEAPAKPSEVKDPPVEATEP